MLVFDLPYINRQTKINRLSKLLRKPWSQLLDSAGNDNNYNQFDIFCFQPSVKFSFVKGEVKVTSKLKLPHFNTTNPINALGDLLNHFKPNNKSLIEGLPFNGGWLGYISYDFGRYLETIPDLTDDDIELPQIQMGLYQWALITDHKIKQTRLINFGLSDKEWQKIIAQFDYLKSDLLSHMPENFQLTSNWKSNTDQQTYDKAFNKIQHYIHSGDCYQVNYAQRFSANYTGSVLTAYQQLSAENKAPFSAYLNFEDHQILSLSPERFIESHQGRVKTQPIKGTRPRSSCPLEDEAQANALKNSEKDKAENLMIVDLLRNDLSRTAAKGSVKVSELFAHYKFASVHHLISTIKSKLAGGKDNFDLLATTLPGGSITGAPKIRAMEIIEELEPVKRNIYCGIIGYIDFNGNMDTNICIRTLIAKNSQLYCWAGGGLVADSDVATEYQETFDKLSKIIPVLKLNDK